jgi:hypothetical protein
MKRRILNRLNLTLKIITRISPKMAFHLIRREIRNRVASNFPSFFQSYIKEFEEKMPDFSHSPKVVSPSLFWLLRVYGEGSYPLQADIRQGIVEVYGSRIDFGSIEEIDWNYILADEGGHHMWRVKLAHMGFLSPILAEGTPEALQLAARLVASAKAATSITGPAAFKGFWFPYAASHRLLALGSGLIAARAKGAEISEDYEALAQFLKENAAFVLGNIEHELCNNHVERNLAGLCLYFSYADHVPQHIVDKLEREVAEIIKQTILKDGIQVERSPMYQGLSFVSLLVMADAYFLSDNLRAVLRAKAIAAQNAFVALCHADGQIAVFNDAWHGEIPVWSGQRAASGRILLVDGGYGRLSHGSNVCIMDAGPLGPSWNPGHGHSDFLSIEVSINSDRLLVDPGTSSYSAGWHRSRERSAEAHNGPTWSEKEPVEFLDSFKVVDLAEAKLAEEADLPQDTIAGLFQSKWGLVARAIRLYPTCGWAVADVWNDTAAGQVHWLVPCDWKLSQDGHKFHARHGQSGNEAWISVLRCGSVHLQPLSYSARKYGVVDYASSIFAYPTLSDDGKTQELLTWVGWGAEPLTVSADGKLLVAFLKEFIQKKCESGEP